MAMARLNRKLIAHNVADARERLESLERRLEDGTLREGHLQVMLEHAYHHMNVAWNARHAPIGRYRRMSDRDFNTWGRFPRNIELPKLPTPAKRSASSNPPLQPTRRKTPRG